MELTWYLLVKRETSSPQTNQR